MSARNLQNHMVGLCKQSDIDFELILLRISELTYEINEMHQLAGLFEQVQNSLKSFLLQSHLFQHSEQVKRHAKELLIQLLRNLKINPICVIQESRQIQMSVSKKWLHEHDQMLVWLHLRR